jgi:hypothetical protein
MSPTLRAAFTSLGETRLHQRSMPAAPRWADEHPTEPDAANTLSAGAWRMVGELHLTDGSTVAARESATPSVDDGAQT